MDTATAARRVRLCIHSDITPFHESWPWLLQLCPLDNQQAWRDYWTLFSFGDHWWGNPTSPLIYYRWLARISYSCQADSNPENDSWRR